MAARDFGGRVEELRLGMELSKSELGRRVGVSPTCVWNWEKKNRTPEKDTMVNLAAALNTSIVYLVTGRDIDEMNDGKTFDDHLSIAKRKIAQINNIPMSRVQITVRII